MRFVVPPILLIIIIVGLGINACGDNHHKAALNYHDSLVIEQVRISLAVNEMNAALETFYAEDMERAYQMLGQQLEKSDSKLAAISDFKGDKEFLDASRKMVAEHQKLYTNEYKLAKELLTLPDSMFSDEQELKVNKLLKTIDIKLEKIIVEYSKSQEEFSKKYGLQQ